MNIFGLHTFLHVIPHFNGMVLSFNLIKESNNYIYTVKNFTVNLQINDRQQYCQRVSVIFTSIFLNTVFDFTKNNCYFNCIKQSILRSKAVKIIVKNRKFYCHKKLNSLV